MDIFIEIAAILVIAGLLSICMRLLRQPYVVGYIFAGIIVGPNILDIFHSQHEFELLAKLGVTTLLFIVGLNLSPQVIKDLGKVSLVTGIGQIVFTSFIGFIIAILLGLSKVAALYTAIALTFSSTIIIVKLLSDKRALNKLYGKIAIGFLLVQDIMATIVLIVISTFQTGTVSTAAIGLSILMVLIKGFALIGVLLWISNLVLPALFRFAAQSSELLFILTIGWGVGLAGSFSLAGFSPEIGALVAGVSLASTPFSYEIGSRLKPLRDFFIVLFFVLLGANMDFGNIAQYITPAVILSAFVLIGNPIILIVIMNLLGFSRKTSFQTALATAQISEFSLIVAAIGFQIGHIDAGILSLITLVGIITITLSTYLILYSEKIFTVIDPYIRFLELRKGKVRNEKVHHQYTALLFGFDRVGRDFITTFEALEQKFAIIDFNPKRLELAQKAGYPTIYGDADDVEFFEELQMQDVGICISSIPSHDTNLLICKHLKKINPKSIFICIARDATDATELYDQGVDYVYIPHYLGAQFAAKKIIKLGLRRSEYKNEREKHISHLLERYLPHEA